MTVTSEFKFVGGRLCLDFVNTASARTEIPEGDKLVDYGNLVDWSELAGLIAPGGVKQNAQVHARAIEFREALYRLFTSVVNRAKPATADLSLLERELSIAHHHERLRYSDGAFALTWDAPVAPARMLWAVALSAAELLVSEDLKKIRQCADQECGWLFLDTSRNRSRQWCDMKDCGNRAKLRRFRQRRHTPISS